MGTFSRYRAFSILACATVALALTATFAHAGENAPKGPQRVPVRHEISGDSFPYEVTDDDTSRSIAAHFGEPDDIVLLNGGEPEPGAKIVVDNRHVAPAEVADGVVINIPQRMLFVFRDGKLAEGWPATVGRPDWPTPLGSFFVASKRLNPTWHVPPAIRAEMEDEGIDPGSEVKPGPRNPLGKNFLGLDHGGIGIHATNRPLSIYLFGSHGCIRLNPDSASKLFHMTAASEPVEIIYQPVALAVLSDGRIFLESDSDPYAMGVPHLPDVREAARAAGVEDKIDWQRASRVMVMVEGVARRIDKERPTVADSAPQPKASPPAASNAAADDDQAEPNEQN
ncbi:MAG TPA: L,D-transpeptidase [Candidatus Binataceae bacterium]|nr:L,D-transpeptidase [Candidatus Binataceae bacterium]